MENMMSCSGHRGNASPYLARQQQGLRNRRSIKEHGSTIAYCLHSAHTMHGAPPKCTGGLFQCVGYGSWNGGAEIRCFAWDSVCIFSDARPRAEMSWTCKGTACQASERASGLSGHNDTTTTCQNTACLTRPTAPHVRGA